MILISWISLVNFWIESLCFIEVPGVSSEQLFWIPWVVTHLCLSWIGHWHLIYLVCLMRLYFSEFFWCLWMSVYGHWRLRCLFQSSQSALVYTHLSSGDFLQIERWLMEFPKHVVTTAVSALEGSLSQVTLWLFCRLLDVQPSCTWEGSERMPWGFPGQVPCLLWSLSLKGKESLLWAAWSWGG